MAKISHQQAPMFWEILENKVFQEWSYKRNGNNKNYAPKLIFFFFKDSDGFWQKSNFGTFSQLFLAIQQVSCKNWHGEIFITCVIISQKIMEKCI